MLERPKTVALIMCGLIPERHINSRETDGDPGLVMRLLSLRLPSGFDVVEGSYNDVFVWLAQGMDPEDVLKVDKRMLSVTTRCEDGTMAMIPDTSPTAEDGTMMSTAMVPAPGMVTIIDPMSEMLMPYTSQCMAGGGRGILQFMMPDKSYRRHGMDTYLSENVQLPHEHAGVQHGSSSTTTNSLVLIVTWL